MKKIKYRRLAAMAASLLCCLIFTVPAYAQSSEPQPTYGEPHINVQHTRVN